jgi:hypothetical protein
VHKDMRTHGSEGATELGQDGPRPIDPGQPAWPTLGSVWAPFFSVKLLQTYVRGDAAIHRESHSPERPSTS